MKRPYRPTPCDWQVLQVLPALEVSHRWLPSLAEIGQAAGLSENTVRDCVGRLKAAGLVENHRGLSRTTHLTDQGKRAALGLGVEAA